MIPRATECQIKCKNKSPHEAGDVGTLLKWTGKAADIISELFWEMDFRFDRFFFFFFALNDEKKPCLSNKFVKALCYTIHRMKMSDCGFFHWTELLHFGQKRTIVLQMFMHQLLFLLDLGAALWS